MTGPVDVMAVLDREIADFGSFLPERNELSKRLNQGQRDRIEARAAIAELIEAAKGANSQISTAQAFVRAMELQRAGLPLSAQLAPELSRTYRDLKAALARCGGAS